MIKKIPHIKQKGGLVAEYPQIEKFIRDQIEIHWTHTEIKMEKDVHDILVNLSPAEKHGVIFNQKLFTMYEVFAGQEYWGDRFKKIFPRIEFQELASCFSFYELCVHKRFYQMLNEKLHLHHNEFYEDYVNDPVLKARMDCIDKYINDPDDLVSLGVFSMVEGAILYSSFAFFKHFRAEGNNKLRAFVSGINFSARDENLHSDAGAYCFKVLLDQSELTPEETEELYAKIYAAAEELREHEHQIADKTFDQGTMSGITATQMKNFADSRIDICLEKLGMTAQYKPSYNPIAEWFYIGLSNAKQHDFFAGQGSNYSRDWQEDDFDWSWEPKKIEEENTGENI